MKRKMNNKLVKESSAQFLYCTRRKKFDPYPSMKKNSEVHVG